MKKASKQHPFKRRDGKSGPDPHRNRAASVPDNAHLIDGRYPSLSDWDSANDGGNTPLPSKGEDSSHDGDDEDNYAMAMAPPAKRAKTSGNGSVHRRARKVIAKSNDDDDAKVDNAFMAEVNEMLKGSNVYPLAIA